LRFNKESRRDGSGKANVEPRVGEVVWGVLYTVRNADLQTLDYGEGQGYCRRNIPVRTTDGPTEAWVYFARNPSLDPALRPYTWYQRFLIEGAREHGLPADYIEALERIEANDDMDQQRDAEKRALICRAE
jgi:gamma-glutamylcyclotransferase